MQLTIDKYTLEYYTEHKANGLDYLGYGGWQDNYAQWLTEVFSLKAKKVLDVGCACGSIMRGFGKAGTYVTGVDVSEAMVRLGKNKWPDMSPIMYVCDAVNLHFFDDNHYDAIHSAQVFEHLREDYVPLIFREFMRVLKPGGLIIAFFDTFEYLDAAGRIDREGEDPTHICIKKLDWWVESAKDAGLEVLSDFDTKLVEHPLAKDYINKYKWPYLIARNPGVDELA